MAGRLYVCAIKAVNTHTHTDVAINSTVAVKLLAGQSAKFAVFFTRKKSNA